MRIKGSSLFFFRSVGLTLLSLMVAVQCLTIYNRWDSWPLTYYPMFAEPLNLNTLYGFRIVGYKGDHSAHIIHSLHGKASWATLNDFSTKNAPLEFRQFLDQNIADDLKHYNKIILYKISLNQEQTNFIWTKIFEVNL